MDKKLTKLHYDILADMASRCGFVIPPWDDVVGDINISRDEREALIDALAIEFIATGLQEDLEPNTRGKRIEEAIDFINSSVLE